MRRQLVFGLLSGFEKVRPYAEGDEVVKASGARYVSDNDGGAVLLCLNLSTGLPAVVLEREIAYRVGTQILTPSAGAS